MVSRDDVVYAYRYLLGREPEGEEVILSHMQTAHTRDQLTRNFMASAEYRDVNPWGRRWFITPVLDGQRLMWVDVFDRYIAHECIKGAWGPDEVAIVRRLLRPGDTFIDAGANIGWFTILASTIVGPGGRIHAFEPHPVVGEFLERSIALNGLDGIVTLHRAGLWDETGEMRLAWAEVSENGGASHLAAGDGEGSTVPLVMLDDLALARCDLIKMDVEGAEHRMMLGARATLSRCRPVIMSELHAGQLPTVSGCDVTGFLMLAESLGYVCYAQQGPMRGQRVMPHDPAWQAALLNVLFVPQERADAVCQSVFG